MITKKDLSQMDHNSFEYIVLHGEWRIKRGKRPSAILLKPFNYRNPEKAYAVAKKQLNTPRKNKRKSMFLRSGQTALEAFLGIPAPDPYARKVPHTCYQYY